MKNETAANRLGLCSVILAVLGFLALAIVTVMRVGFHAYLVHQGSQLAGILEDAGVWMLLASLVVSLITIRSPMGRLGLRISFSLIIIGLLYTFFG